MKTSSRVLTAEASNEGKKKEQLSANMRLLNMKRLPKAPQTETDVAYCRTDKHPQH